MVIVVGEPLAQLVSSLFLAGEWSGVEELLGQDTVVALDFAVVPRRVGARVLVAAHEIAGRVVESGGAVGRPVVGDQARNAPNPVGLEEDAGEERDRGGGPLVVEGLGGGVGRLVRADRFGRGR